MRSKASFAEVIVLDNARWERRFGSECVAPEMEAPATDFPARAQFLWPRLWHFPCPRARVSGISLP